MRQITLSKRRVALIFVFVAIAAALAFAFGTVVGRRWMDPRVLRGFFLEHEVIAPAACLGLYCVFGCTLAPLWWLQGIAGYCFGAVQAIVICQVGNAVVAFVTVSVSEWMIADISLKKLEPMVVRLRRFQGRIGSTGIPLVMAVRLVHFIPFGASNICFSIMKMRPIDAAVGTLIGNLASVGFYVILGSVGYESAGQWPHTWELIGGLLTLNAILLTPIVVRYVRSGRGATKIRRREGSTKEEN
jgi:uncharacterized membrane protein YdjX (TVP38/TMEM64 family)